MRETGKNKDILDRALEAYRYGEQEAEVLSSGSRSDLFDRVKSAGREPEAFSGPFIPFRRLVAASAATMLLAALVMSWTLIGDGIGDGAGAMLQASKVGDQVVFTIANGGAEHKVLRSYDPRRFDTSDGMAVDTGSFSDNLENGSQIVFYRID